MPLETMNRSICTDDDCDNEHEQRGTSCFKRTQGANDEQEMEIVVNEF